MQKLTHVWEGGRATTLKDVARLVGVSESVASVVLNGARSHTRVSTQTRDRVNMAAKELGYRPNAVAKALSSGRTGRIGVYASRFVDNASDLFWASLQVGLYRSAREHGVDVVIHTNANEESRMVEMLSDRFVDGLLMISLHPDDPVIPHLGERRVPVVAIVDRSPLIPCVIADDQGGGRILAEHLWERGHRSTLLLKRCSPMSHSSLARTEGFCSRAQSLGMRVHVDESGFGIDMPFSKEQVRMLTEGPNRATAIFARNDGAAYLNCDELHAMGIDIPETVAVVGFDGNETCYDPRLPLTTIKANWDEVASTGVEVLMNLVNGNPVESVTTIPVSFKQGETT